jgi:hypothetical protein
MSGLGLFSFYADWNSLICWTTVFSRSNERKNMPSKKIFDLIVVTTLLLHPAVGLLKMSARRWSRESQNKVCATLGDALTIGL